MKLDIDKCEFNNIDGDLSSEKIKDFVEKNNIDFDELKCINGCGYCKNEYLQLGKFYYIDEENGILFIDLDEALNKCEEYENGEVTEVQIYLCECGGWCVDYTNV